MATPTHVRLPNDTADQDPLLEARPGNWRKQLWLKGRNMSVGQLIYNMRASGMLDSPAAAAQNFAVPVEQVQQALDYYRCNRDVIERDAEEEKRWLLDQGYSLEPKR